MAVVLASATVPMQPLAQEFPYATGVAVKKKQNKMKQTNKKTMRKEGRREEEREEE